jgi:mono/diheme cytochrome c family protein
MAGRLMEPLHDLTLPLPLPEAVQRGLLFGTFTLHLLFVLLMLGTAILALSYFIHAWWHGRLGELRWDKQILRIFLAHKSLAVVLGVGPLLLIQVAFTIPFFTAIVLLAPFWLLIIGFLIVSFISFDSLGHRIDTHRYLHLGFGMVAMITLLCVPGFFVAVLVATENPRRWMDIFGMGFAFDWRLTVHWIFRYLHVLGAALVFGGAFHYFFVARRYPRHRASLLRWMLLGLVLQVVLGIALYWSLLQEVPPIVYAYLSAGIGLTAVMIWVVATTMGSRGSLNHTAVIPLLLALLVSMLLARQEFQDQAVSPVLAQVEQATAGYMAKLQPYEKTALAHYRERMNTVYDTGPIVYSQSCAFCHGQDANGNGPDAKYLHVPPEHISAIRAQRSYIMRILDDGVAGSAMPRFTYYERQRREQVGEYLNKTYNIFSLPGRLPVPISSEMRQKAQAEWDETCSSCHGKDGAGSKSSARFRPPPPNLTEYSLTPQRIRHVIENGYPGTMMSSYSSLGDREIDALVDHVVSFRLHSSSTSAEPSAAGGPEPNE